MLKINGHGKRGAVMPSVVSVLLREEIRFLKPIINRLSIETARSFQDKLGDMEAKSVASRVDFSFSDINGLKACFAELKASDYNKERVVLYLHGGAYVAGDIQYAKGFAGILAAETKRRVLSIAYRLAPENPFPAAVEDAFSAYEYLLNSGYTSQDISLVGESAGGGLIYCLCLLLKQKKMPLPAALVGISPWTDLAFSGESYKQNDKKDPSLSEDVLREHATAYAPGQARNPLVSPVFGELSSFPPSLLFAGGDELLLDDARMLAKRLMDSGSRCELVIEEGLWHVYVLYKIPEAKKAIRRIAAFLEKVYEKNPKKVDEIR
jgi:monoterpene epsilon-lactone hydrolase